MPPPHVAAVPHRDPVEAASGDEGSGDEGSGDEGVEEGVGPSAGASSGMGRRKTWAEEVRAGRQAAALLDKRAARSGSSQCEVRNSK
jgi:hypothetical protein